MRTAFRNLLTRLKGLFSPAAVRRDIQQEFQFHLEMRIDEYVNSGMSPEAARQEAMRRFGNSTALRDRSWDERGGGFLEILLKDLSYGLRTLLRKPLLTVTALLTLGLGIGANTAVFSVLNSTLLAPLPYFRPDRLMTIWEDHRTLGSNQVEFSPANYTDLRGHSRSASLSPPAVCRRGCLLSARAKGSKTGPLVRFADGLETGAGLLIGDPRFSGSIQPSAVFVVTQMSKFSGAPGLAGTGLLEVKYNFELSREKGRIVISKAAGERGDFGSTPFPLQPSGLKNGAAAAGQISVLGPMVAVSMETKMKT